MEKSTSPINYDWRARLQAGYDYLRKQLTSPWTKLIFLASLTILFTQRDLRFGLRLNASGLWPTTTEAALSQQAHESGSAVPARNVSQFMGDESQRAAVDATAPDKRASDPLDQRRQAYIEQYLAAARAEEQAHGIPVSITLAQGLLESGAGQSTLATRANNHFGIKCFSRSCSRGHCTNFDDDSHKDFFVVYDSPEDSYAGHSRVLRHRRYRALFDLPLSDYKGWARGLSRAGYATDPRYAEKLIKLIERYRLDRYDLAR